MPPSIQVMWDAFAPRRWFGLLEARVVRTAFYVNPGTGSFETATCCFHGTTAGPILVVAAACTDPNEAQL